MRKLKLVSSVLAGLALLGGHSWHARAADKTDTAQSLHRAVPAGAAKYGAIDGKHLHDYVKQITAISRRYRDQGHQFWGRIQGTAADLENAEWVAARFKAIGLDVRTQPFDLPEQWMPQSWDVTATSGSRTARLTTAQPGSRTPGTQGALNLEVAYVGLGTAADFAGRDVRGKAALVVDDFVISAGTLVDVVEKLIERGAAAVYAAVTHGVFSQGSMERIGASPIQLLLVTDTVETQPVVLSPKIEVVSVASLFGEAIRRIHCKESISVLFPK